MDGADGAMRLVLDGDIHVVDGDDAGGVLIGLFPTQGVSWVRFGCGREYLNDPEGEKRHRASGCKGCRRYLRRMDARTRKAGLNMAEVKPMGTDDFASTNVPKTPSAPKPTPPSSPSPSAPTPPPPPSPGNRTN